VGVKFWTDAEPRQHRAFTKQAYTSERQRLSNSAVSWLTPFTLMLLVAHIGVVELARNVV